MPTVASFWRAGAREVVVVRAIRLSSYDKFPFCTLRNGTRKPFLQQEWQFRATRETNSLAGTTKTRPHVKDLIVAELTRNSAAKTHERSFGCTVLSCDGALSL